MEVKVTRSYQITIPAEIREELGIKIGDILEIILDKKEKRAIIKKKEGKWPEISIGRKIKMKDIKMMLEEVREEICI